MIQHRATRETAFQIMNQLTIGILVTNTDNSEFAGRWPRDGEKFTTLLKSVRPQWMIKVYDCTKGEFPASPGACDGYVIGGSPSSVNDGDEWITRLFALIRTLDQTRTPTIGCCFGHQAISKALGGTVGRNPEGWGFGVSATHFASTETWMKPEKRTLNLYAAHREQTLTLPEGARILGGDSFCPTASLAIGDHMFTTEYHPEMTKSFFQGLIEAFASYTGPDVAEAARQQAASIDADGQVFAQWMANFLEMKRNGSN